MKSIRDLYKVGKGPSSSHTMGPERAARIFKQENPGAERYEVTLYGSLALTGVGHGTDRVLSEVLAPTPTEIIFSKKDPGDLRHPNTLDFAAYKGEEKFASMRVESIGGGDIVIEGREAAEPDDVYPENSFAEIAQYCRWRYISLREYVELNEGPEIWDFLQTIWRTMRAEVEEGLEATGILPGGLNCSWSAPMPSPPPSRTPPTARSSPRRPAAAAACCPLFSCTYRANTTILTCAWPTRWAWRASSAI